MAVEDHIEWLGWLWDPKSCIKKASSKNLPYIEWLMRVKTLKWCNSSDFAALAKKKNRRMQENDVFEVVDLLWIKWQAVRMDMVH